MSRTWWIALVLTCACSKSQPAGEATTRPVAKVAPADASPPVPPPPHPVVRVETGVLLDVANTIFELRSYTTESTDEGDGVAIEMTLAGERVTFSDPPPGGESKLVVWAGGFRVQVVDHAPGFVSLHVDRVTDEVVPDSEKTVHVVRKKSADIGGGVSLRFAGHGHKTVATGGPKGPLMVAVAYLRGEKNIGEGRYDLYPPEQADWTWRDYAFHLDDYGYASFMVLRVSRRVLAPVE